MGFCKLVCVQSSPNLVFNQSARDEGPFPKCGRRAAILGEEMRKGYGGVYIDHRSLRSPSRSARISVSGKTGFGLGGGPSKRRVGGVNQPLRTASASTASPNTGLRDSLGGPISATTRSRSVTRIVSPAAAIRMYSLNRLLSTLIPTARIRLNVATCCYFVKDR